MRLPIVLMILAVSLLVTLCHAAEKIDVGPYQKNVGQKAALIADWKR